MSKRKQITNHAFRQGRTVASMTTISAAVSAILLQGGVASAADSTDQLEEVVVTGLRHSIESSIAVKRSSDSIVESITAEDIGKLPDQSIAESIARLPGLAAQRVAGRAQAISIRGLSDDFAVTLMNGRELVSTGDNRGVEYDQYPSELISAVTVYKTPDAALGAQGLSGTVDLQTIRPLDQDQRAFVVNGRIEKNSNGALNAGVSGRGERYNVAYVDQFADHKLGVAIGYAHLNSPEQEQHFGAWWWDRGFFPELPPGVVSPLNPDVVALQGAEVTAASSVQQRDSVMAVIEYQPNAEFRSAVDLYYSNFDQKYTMRGLLWSSGGAGWGDGVGVNNPILHTDPVTGDSVLVGGALTGIRAVEQSNYNTRTDRLMTLGWNNGLKLDTWELVSDLSYSQMNRREHTIETYVGAFDQNGPIADNNFRFSSPVGTSLPSFTPGLNYADPNILKLSDPEGWGQDGYVRWPNVHDQMSTLKLSARRPLGWIFSDIDTGVSYSDRSKRHQDHDYQYFLSNNRTPIAISQDLLTTPTSLAWAGIPGVLAYDVPAVLNKYYDVPPGEDTIQPYIWARNYTVIEKVTTLFTKLTINSDVATIPVHGNIGLQLVHTNQSSSGNASLDRSARVSGGAAYNDVLPSLNLKFDLQRFSDNLALRFGAAKTMARARIDDLKAGFTSGVDLTDKTWSGNGGNPELRPWRADAFDLSVEKYFSKSSYISVAAFYKRLHSYIYTQSRYIDFTGYPNSTGVTPIGGNLGYFSLPENGEGGKVQGTEFTLALDGGLLAHALTGFGFEGNYSKTTSDVRPNGPGTTDNLPGLSGDVANLTFYYEAHGFSTRISRRYRSPFRAESLGPHGSRIATEIRAENILDFQASYEFADGAAKGLTVLFQVDNLRDSPARTRYIGGYNGTIDMPEQYNTYGRQVLFGLNYKL